VRTLDHLLYAWLAEADEQRFEQAFNAYFVAAFPAVVRHLAHLSRWSIEQLEDIAQEALLQFFDRVARARRDAAQAMAGALTRIQPLNLGPLHEQQVTRWTEAISAFRARSLAFQAQSAVHYAGFPGVVRSLAEEVRLLQAEGYRLLHSLELALRVHSGGVSGEIAAVGEGDHRDRARWLAAELAGDGPAVLAAEQCFPGVQRFTIDVHTLIEAISQLQLPTNSFLFEIAASKYLDESRRRGRLKRGGTGKPSSGPHSDDSQRHPLELLAINEADDSDAGHQGDSLPSACMDAGVSDSSISAFDPAHACEHEDFFEQFCDYLRQPLEYATLACDAERLSGRSVPDSARRKVESLTAKFSRTMSVLSLLGEGYTQQQTAEQLGLSRNQVKYIVELVQVAYASFVMGAQPAATSSLIGKDARGP